jgi:hypothetical protein
MPIDYNPIWSSAAGRENAYVFESTDSFGLTDSAGVLFDYLIGDALSIADLSRERDRQFAVKATIDGVDYDNKKIVDFEIDNSLVLGEEFEIGTAVLSKLVIKLKTSDTIAPNAKIVPYLAMIINGERVTDWYPMGEFYVDSREQIKDVWAFTCYDKLVRADVPYISALTYPTTQQAVWDEICTSLGFAYDSSVVINPSYMIQAGPAGYRKRQVLGYIASANSASAYIAKDGTLCFRRFSAADVPVIALTESDYMRAKQLNPVKTYTKVVVTYNTEDGLTYEAGSGDENHTLYVENPFATQAITNDLYARLNGFSYTPVSMDARGYPGIEAGDRIRYGVYVGTPTWETADMAWEDADFSWDGYKSGGETLALHTVFSFRGGLKMSIEAPSKSEQKSEFIVEGTLSQQVNRLNQNALKLGRSYFGATITRTEGLIVEKEDHSSKVTLNSDELKWEVGGVKRLHYDAVADKLKFGGTLEAADGIFSGTISASDIIGGTIEGANISTGASYPRVEISSDDTLVRAAFSETEYIAIEALNSTYGSPTLTFVSGSYLSGIRQENDTFVIGSPTGPISLSSNGQMSLIASSGALTASSSGGFILDIVSEINSKADSFVGLTDTVDLTSIGGPKMIFSNGVLIGVV